MTQLFSRIKTYGISVFLGGRRGGYEGYEGESSWKKGEKKRGESLEKMEEGKGRGVRREARGEVRKRSKCEGKEKEEKVSK